MGLHHHHNFLYSRTARTLARPQQLVAEEIEPSRFTVPEVPS